MIQTKKVLMIVLVISAIIIAGCSDSMDELQLDSAALTEEFIQGESLKASFTDSRVAGMKGIAENDNLQLLVTEQTGEIAVIDKNNGEIWYSNPPESDSDAVALGINKQLLSSQMKLDYYNMSGQINSINSKTDSADYNQIRFEPISNGVRVTYRFGKYEKTLNDLPMLISKSRFEQLATKLDETGQRALQTAYTEDVEKSVYVRGNDQILQGIRLKRALQAFEDAGYTEEDLLLDIEEHQLDQPISEPRVFQAAIEYTLDANSLVAKIPSSSIQYPEDYPISQLSIMNYFGAGGVEEEGSLFVPDGSGALINFNNGKTQYSAYQQQVYGTDMTLESYVSAVSEESVRLPVFGIIREGSAFLGIIEDGAAAASIHADVSGKLNSYNYVYPIFTVLNNGEVTLNANGKQRSLPKFQENKMKSDFTIRYAFLDGEEASYKGMAQYFQKYLLAKNGLPQLVTDTKSEDSPFYLQVVGSINKEKKFAGIPYESLEPLTTFEQTKDIITEMKQRDINHIKLQYSGWFNNGLNHGIPKSISIDKEVGGKKGFRDFTAFAQEQEISFYPDVALLTAYTDDHFNTSKDAARTIKGVPARIFAYDMGLDGRDRSRIPSHVISPRLVNSYVDGMLNDLLDLPIQSISLRDLADQLNSDYRKNKQIDRTESEEFSINALNQIGEASLSVIANGGNSYALPFLTDITNAPMTSSKFKIADEEIPFYQMVVRGSINYTGAPYNLSTFTSMEQYILKCLEYGSGVYFEWIYEPNHTVKDTDYNNLYAVNYELWIDQASEIYNNVNEVLRKVQNERIIGHEKLTEGVYKTVYESMYVIVNYNHSQVTIDGRTIDAESYITGGEQS
ncbi:DUF5696 domain-containing protein [Paenibacillus endoradicis]|uniref:DUF5696 domain-containing protein n=1 Tax=Paenibacillus endoradicis TaxID=2972487 RepID=UPI002158AB15|nr:DUF5696 domain-containing protein [Paenibacillus endoradicis]MCR8655927.1 DUF5696 domain-containing protein [Paenibacillus endoradicis]MCR8658253.1 DUF5696 domain-containing protein [Paenibacillus endoradicis]